MSIFAYRSFIESVLPVDLSRDIDFDPPPQLPIEILPVIGPTLLPLPSRPGVGVGAKLVSFEFGVSPLSSGAKFSAVSGWDQSEEWSRGAGDVCVQVESRESGYRADSPIERIDAPAANTSVSIDLGLLSLVADGSLAIDE